MIIFIPNGFGDLIMSLPAINLAIDYISPSKITLVVLSDKHKEMILFFIKKPINIIIRRDGRLLSDSRLFFKLMALESKVLVAPLVSSKLKNKIFFSLLPKKIVSSLKVLKIFRNENIKISDNLNTYNDHQVNYIQTLVSTALKIHPKKIKYLDFGFEAKNWTSGKIKICLGISCGEKEKHKVPSPKYFADLVNFLSSNIDCEFHLVYTDSDYDKVKIFKQSLGFCRSNINYYNNLSFDDLSELIQNLNVGISGMSGQGHLMSAFGLPLVILSGVTNPKESAPLTQRAVICSHDFICGPCYQEDFLIGCGKVNCMDTINFKEILAGLVFLTSSETNGDDWYKSCVKQTIPINKLTDLIGKKPFNN